MSTDLKNFHQTLMSVQENEQKLNDLHECYKTRDPAIPLENVICTMSNGDVDVSFTALYSEMLGTSYRVNDYDAFLQDLKDIQGGIQTSLPKENLLKEKSKEVNDIRNNLDKKMKDMYDPTQDDDYILYQSTIYMSMAWAILGASIIYYISQKL